MLDQIGNQNVGFLMTRLTCSVMLQLKCPLSHEDTRPSTRVVECTELRQKFQNNRQCLDVKSEMHRNTLFTVNVTAEEMRCIFDDI